MSCTTSRILVCGLTLLFSTVLAGRVAGQSSPVSLSMLVYEGAAAVSTEGSNTRPAASHYDVVALRVEFQPDTTRYTTGDGTFGGSLFDSLRASVDPLPHDASYFEAHLSFLENYVEKVSDGKTTVSTHLLPGVVQVSKPMAAYSPVGPDSDSDVERAKLAELVLEAWRLADEQISFDVTGYDPETTAFIIFHAGVGRDLELTGTTLDRTPQDLPSIFFDSSALGKLLPGAQITFKGLPVDHTILLPRTETRRGFDFISEQPFLIELSINGMMAASFFNYLGVPDLFNTETGASVIGPFGLMDPLGIFAYGGLLPPEPSAWTRLYLGWAEPIELKGNEPVEVTLPAVGLDQGPDVARAWISDTEYFLVENRNRDPEGNGLILQVWKEGEIVEQRVAHGDESFNSTTQDSFIGGVVVNADDYDWSIPGGLDENGNILDGGMLIWHVDTHSFEQKLAENRVNVDEKRRLVDLEEADGAQDIGKPSSNPFGPQVDAGSPFDFFYQDNPITVETQAGQRIRLYTNEFGPDTQPGSDSNLGGPSFISLGDFSEPGAEMRFTYQKKSSGDGPAPLSLFSQVNLEGVYGRDAEVTSSVNGSILFVNTGTSNDQSAGDSSHAYVLDATTGSVTTSFEGYDFGQFVTLENGSEHFLSVTDSLVSIYLLESGEAQSRLDGKIDAGYRLHAPAVAAGEAGVIYVRATCENPVCEQEGPESKVYRFELSGGQLQVDELGDGDGAAALSSDGENLILVREGVTTIKGTDLEWNYTFASGDIGQPVFGKDRTGIVGVVPGETESVFLLSGGTVQIIPSGLNGNPVLADLDGDGSLDVLGVEGDRLVAYTQGGALVSGFPIRVQGVVSQPLVARLTDSGGWSILAASTEGYLYAFDLEGNGGKVAGFPLPVGYADATPLLRDNRLYAVSREGGLYAWEFTSMGDIWWGERYGGGKHHSFVVLEDDPDNPPVSSERLIVERETYNWPNPIREGETFLRCQTTRDARIRVTIVNMAGGLVDEFEVENIRGGVPVEYAWHTDAPSGLYIARITATADDGMRESYLVKMAVIR